MSIRRSYDRALQKRKEDEVKQAEILRRLSKERLKRAITKKFQTCFIGSVNSVEDHLGVLWGKNSSEQLTQFQIRVLERWKILRTEILDKGNAQLRAMLKEVGEYSVDWDGHHFNIEVE